MSTQNSQASESRTPSSVRARPAATLSARKSGTHNQTSDDDWFAIRDIIGEKTKRGKLLYKVDWADNLQTGEVYEPSWIPAEDANEEAIAEWEREKQLRDDPQFATQESSLRSEPVQPPNWRSTLRTHGGSLRSKRRINLSEDSRSPQKRRRTSRSALQRTIPSSSAEEDSPDEAWPQYARPWPIDQGSRPEIVVDIARRPDFDPSEYTHFASSQLSQVNSSQSSSQVYSTQRSQPEATAGLSQRIIPDSQDLSASASGPSIEEVLSGRDSPLVFLSTIQSQSTSSPVKGSGSGDEIPSHQPDNDLALIATRSRGTEEQGESGSREHHTQTLRGEDSLPWEQPFRTQGTVEFLTQPEFAYSVPAIQSSTSQSLSKSTPSDATLSKISDSVGNQTSSSTRSKARTGSSLHSAQLVQPLSNSLDSIFALGHSQSHNQHVFDVYTEEDHLIPQTAESRNIEQSDSQGSSQALSEVNLNIRKSGPDTQSSGPLRRRKPLALSQDSQAVIQSIEQDNLEENPPLTSQAPLSSHRNHNTPSRTRAPDIAAMEGGPATETPMSAVDELRQLQAAAFMEPSSRITTPSALLPEVQDAGLDQPLVSPSAILSSVEVEGEQVDPLQQFNTISEPEITESVAGGRMSAVEELRLGLGLPLEFPVGTISSASEPAHILEDDPPTPAATIAPTALVTPTELLVVPATSLPVISQSSLDNDMVREPAEPVLPSLDSYEPLLENDGRSSPEAIIMPIVTAPNEYIVTLPLAAQARWRYFGVIQGNQRMVEAFTDIFTRDVIKVPEDGLVADVDVMFDRLLDVGDFPAYVESLPVMSKSDMSRHATTTNGKFLFVHELLEGIRDLDKEVLILSQPGPVMDYMEALAASAGLHFRRPGDGWQKQKGSGDDPLKVTVASCDMDASKLPVEVDVVIGFDQMSRTSDLWSRYLAEGPYDNRPAVLSLVAAHTVEHIDLRLSRTMDPMERKNALVLATYQSSHLMTDQIRGPPEPHEIAEVFSGYIRDPSVSFSWEPHDMPDDALEVYLSSQHQFQPTQVSSMQPEEDIPKADGRKRQLDDIDEGTGTPKRARLGASIGTPLHGTRVELSQTLKNVLGGTISKNSQTVEVSLDQLESMAAKVWGLESQLKEKGDLEEKLKTEVKNLESQVKLHEKTVRKIQPKYMEALRDRGAFEVERDNAVKEAEAAKARLETSKDTIAKLENEKSAFNQKFTELTNSDDPNMSKLGQMEIQLEEAQKKTQALDKKLQIKDKELDYFRDAYQAASKSAAELSAEKTDLLARVTDLEHKASANLGRLHEIHRQNEVDEFRKLWLEQQAIVRERERDLERAREELRTAKNGRRETRQQSVPRSPRMGSSLMSPRPGRNNHSGAPGSRGTSPAPGVYEAAGMGPPVPGMAYFNAQTGNGRWGHLRD